MRDADAPRPLFSPSSCCVVPAIAAAAAESPRPNLKPGTETQTSEPVKPQTSQTPNQTAAQTAESSQTQTCCFRISKPQTALKHSHSCNSSLHSALAQRHPAAASNG